MKTKEKGKHLKEAGGECYLKRMNLWKTEDNGKSYFKW